MIFLKRLWIALSLSAFVALALTPALVAAQIPASSGTGVPASSGTGVPASSGTGIPASQGIGSLSNPLGNVTGLCQLLKIVLNVAIAIGVPIAMLFICFAGLKLVMARGNPTELTRARQNLMWTFIGIAIFLGVWFFVQILANTLDALGVQILGSCS